MTEIENQTSTALAIIQSKPVAEFFVADGLDPVIEAIRKEATSNLPDISTPQGRKEIASRAYKVAQSKTAIDEAGKNLTEEWKTKSKAVDAERKRWRETMDALKEEVRAPLTEWENAEKKRVADHEAAIAELAELAGYADWHSLLELNARIARAAELFVARDWQEFAQRARQTHDHVADALEKKLEARRKYEEEQAELERLRQEKAAREQKEREEAIAAEAAEKARVEAEQKAKAEADAEAARVKAEQEAAAAREADAIREKEEAEARARKAEEDRLAAIAKAEADRKEAEEARLAAEEKAKADLRAAEDKAIAEARAAADKSQRIADEAAQRERAHIAAEKKAEEEATAKREADKAHRGKINRETLAALMSAGLTEELGKLAIEAIAEGLVPHVRISY